MARSLPAAWANVAIPSLVVIAALALSVHLGPDANWDLRNYHIYNPFALLHKAPGTDLLPAQMQGFLPPWPDLPAYWLRQRLTDHPGLVSAIFALPTAMAALLVYAIARRLLPQRLGWFPALGATMIGLTGAAGLPTTGTSASELPAGCLLLGGVLLLMHAVSVRLPRAALLAGLLAALLAGVLFGVAVAIKLTVVPFVAAATIAFALCAGGPWRQRLAGIACLVLGGAAGGVAAGGWWWWHLYEATGNPIFPYFNNVFHSPLTAPVGMTDDRFLPHGTVQSLFYPFFWGFQKTRLVTEIVMRDPRAALAGIAVLVFLASSALRRRADRPGLFLAIFLALGYVLWQRQFAIFRYLAPLETLAGVALLLPLRPAMASRPGLLTGLGLGLCVALALYTRYPNWGRAFPRSRAISVVMPAIPPGSMVLLLTNDPLGYTAAFADPAIRFVGVNNNLVAPGSTTQLARIVETAVRNHPGPLMGIEVAGSTQSAAVLAHYGLRRSAACAVIESNLDGSTLRLCPLARQ